jgi:hypothetical protein
LDAANLPVDVDEIRTDLTLGVGSHVHQYPVYITGTTTPIAGVVVVATSDEAGIMEVRRAVTDVNGIATFHFMEAGGYYFWSYKALYDFINPDYEVVA